MKKATNKTGLRYIIQKKNIITFSKIQNTRCNKKQVILVQTNKEERGLKGAALNTFYLLLVVIVY